MRGGWSPNAAKDASFSLAVVNNEIPGWVAKGQSGKCINIPSGSFGTIWDGNPTIGAYVPPTTDRIHDISSLSIEDNPSGTGVAQILITGVTSTKDNLITEIIILDGTTNVPTVNSYTHINDMTAIAWGSATVDFTTIGTISAIAQTDNTTTALIIAGRNNTLTGVFQVPRNIKYIIPSLTFSIERAGGATITADFRFILFKQGEGFIESIDIGLDDGSPVHSFALDPPVFIPADVYLLPQANPSSAISVINVIYRGYCAPPGNAN